MEKILLLQSEISAYNVSIFNLIAEKYNLTVGYFTKDKSQINCKFKKIFLSSYTLGSFTFIKKLFKKCKEYDAVIFMPSLRIPSYCLIPFLCNLPSISWSIGFRVSYTHPYITSRKHNFLDFLTKLIFNKCSANIFYMKKAKDFWKNSSLDFSKIFIAPNTTDVVNIQFIADRKRDFLFVGTLYKGKGIDLLIKSYKNAIAITNSDRKLVIVGDGEMKQWLEKYINDHSLVDNVELKGAIFNEKELSRIFETSLMCISPTQGGLSVPKSMGYGVPFITRRDAITGGEIYHIHNGIDGIIYDSNNELTDIMVDAIYNPQKYINMGENAKIYYDSNASPHKMTEGFINAIEYALKQSEDSHRIN